MTIIFTIIILIFLFTFLTIFISKGMSKNPPAVFMLFLIVFLFITEASFRNRELDDSSIDFQVILRLSVWFVITLYSLVCYRKIFNLLLDSNVKYLTFYCFFCLITTIYSPIPIYTGVNSLIQFSFLIFAAALAVNLNLKQICLAIFYMSIFFHVISLILVPILPELAVMEYWGPTNNRAFRFGKCLWSNGWFSNSYYTIP